MIVDLTFAIRCLQPIPADHGYLLYSAISRAMPEIHRQAGRPRCLFKALGEPQSDATPPPAQGAGAPRSRLSPSELRAYASSKTPVRYDAIRQEGADFVKKLASACIYSEWVDPVGK